MDKTIDTLVADIYNLFDNDGFVGVSEEDAVELGHKLARHIAYRMKEHRADGTVRMSNVAKPCVRQLWYDVNAREAGEKLNASTKIKFLFGDILETLLLFFAEQAGHTVEREQESVEFSGITGHIDAVIDGVLVDCKSASSYSFKKFATGGLGQDDPFGYLGQLNLYHASLPDVNPDKFGFLVIDKTLGNICLDLHKPTPEKWGDVVVGRISAVNSKVLPPRGFHDEPDGKSGNRKLGVNCSYCSYKEACWPGLTTYFYSNGPRFLTRVMNEPRVTAVKPDEEF